MHIVFLQISYKTYNASAVRAACPIFIQYCDAFIQYCFTDF